MFMSKGGACRRRLFASRRAERAKPSAAIAALLAVALHATAAGAVVPPLAGWHPGNAITFGPSMGAARAPRLGWVAVPGAELTYLHSVHTPLYFWLSAGARLFADREGVAGLPYVEAGLALLFVNLGIGYGRGLGDDRAPRDTINGFVGLAIPLYEPRRGHLLFLEPYYRPTGALTPDRYAIHEFGVALKWLWMLSPG
jgi:hypothetical protein